MTGHSLSPTDESAPSAAVAQSTTVVPDVPSLQQLDETLRTRRIQWAFKQYIHQGWIFTKINICTLASATFLWGLVLLGGYFSAALLSFSVLEHLYGKGDPLFHTDRVLDQQGVEMEKLAFVLLMRQAFSIVVDVVLLYPCLASYYAAIFKAMRMNLPVRFCDLFCTQLSCCKLIQLMFLALVLSVGRTFLSLLFVVPGVYFALVTSFAVPLFVEHPVGICGAICRSTGLVHRYFCSILGFTLLLGCMQIMGFLTLGLGLLVSVPLALVSHAYAYHDLVGVNSVPIITQVPSLSAAPPEFGNVQQGVAIHGDFV